MLSQTISQIQPLLEVIHQPAFTVSDGGVIAANAAAQPLAPADGAALPDWLGPCRDVYDSWDRRQDLSLAVTLLGKEYQLSAHALADGTLLLMSGGGANEGDLFAVASQVLRQPLADLSALSQQLSEELQDAEDPFLWEQAAALSRHIYRLTRITCNLSDLERLRTGQYPPQLEALELRQFLEPVCRECRDAFAAGGRVLEYRLPQESIALRADPVLLERALLNLFSNALKYGDPAKPISFWCDITPGAVLFCIRNHCSQHDADLLYAAFQRLSRRGALPDPRWGLGLGLPLAQAIARLHGGAVALEQSKDGSVTAAVSFSRRQSRATGLVETPPFDYTGGMRRSLVELSESLPTDCFRVDTL